MRMVCVFGTDRTMKGEYFIMNKNGLRRIFSLLLAVMMVCALLPTAAFAEDVVEPQDENGDVAAYANSSVPLTLNISSYNAPFYNPTKGTHDVSSFKFSKYINRSDVGSDNPKDCSATAHFVGSNEAGWQLYVKVKLDNYEADFPQNAWIYNKDMSAATGYVTFGLSFNTAGGTSTYVHISGGKDLPTPPQPDKPTKPTAEDVKALLGNEVVKIFCGTAGSGVHPAAAYPLKDGSFTVGDVNSSGDIPTCDITVNAQPYVEDYNTKYTGHTLSTADYTPKVIALEYDSSTKTWSPKTPLPIIFNVVCDTAPSVPEQATKDDVLGANIKVTIVCDNTDVNHGSKDFDLIEDAIKEISAPRQSSVGTYICDVTVSSESYVPQFDQDKKATHTPPAATEKITLSYVDGKWIAPSIDTAYPHVNFTVRCGTKPAAPNHDELSKLIGDITVKCTNDAATHDPKSKGYALIADSYTTSGVEGDAENGYTYTVTIKSEKYVNQFDTDTGSAHTPKDGKTTVVLEYKDKAWAVKSGTSVSFDVACGTEIVPPTKPTLDDLRKLLGQVIVDCTTNDKHPDGKYDLIEDSYIANIEDQNGTYVCMVSVYADKYVAKYNETYSGHSLAGSANSDKVKLVYLRATKTDTGYTPWSVSEAEPLTFAVKCSTEIDPSKKPTLEQLPEISVTLHCGTTSAHREPTWSPLLENTYEISTPMLKNDVYTCTLTIKAEKYVDEYSGTVHSVGKHELDDDAAKDITLTWKDGKWTAETSKVTFNVKCKLLTVTYTDGVKGKEVFKDVVYKDIPYGAETPAFGTKNPTRKGYTFTGWSPKVADTVTGNVTYKAQWKSNSGKDNVPKTGDGDIVMILGSVLLFSFCGAAAVCVFDRKRKQG